MKINENEKIERKNFESLRIKLGEKASEHLSTVCEILSFFV